MQDISICEAWQAASILLERGCQADVQVPNSELSEPKCKCEQPFHSQEHFQTFDVFS